ncbi:MAG: hypothetical protein RI894_2169, partial [Bacteroidota bacterium]
APKHYDGGHELVFEALHAVDLTKINDRKAVETILATHLQNDNATRQFLLKNLTRSPDTLQLAWKMNLPVLETFYQKILCNIAVETTTPLSCPTLFLRGGNSRYVLDDDFAAIQQLFTNSQLETIPHAGHWLHAENPAAFSTAVLHFLEKG